MVALAGARAADLLDIGPTCLGHVPLVRVLVMSEPPHTTADGDALAPRSARCVHVALGDFLPAGVPHLTTALLALSQARILRAARSVQSTPRTSPPRTYLIRPGTPHFTSRIPILRPHTRLATACSRVEAAHIHHEAVRGSAGPSRATGVFLNNLNRVTEL